MRKLQRYYLTYCNTLISMELLDLIMEYPINERMDEGGSFRCTLGMKQYIGEQFVHLERIYKK